MSSQVDNASQALDRLAEVFGPRVPAKHASYLERVRNERIADLATVRQRLADQDTEIQRLREERDMARVGRDQALRDAKGRGVVQYELLDRAKAAEAEVQQLREERDEYAERLAWHREERDAYLKGNVWVTRAAEEQSRAEAAEAEVQRYREGLREAVDMIRFPCAECKPFIDKARALLADSPPDGEPVYCVCGNILGSKNCCPEPDQGGEA